MRLTQGRFLEASQIYLHGQVGPRCTTELVGHLVGFPVTLGGFKVDCLKFFLKAKIISYAQRVEKISLCETDSPDTGEVALAPEGERCLEGAEGEKRGHAAISTQPDSRIIAVNIQPILTQGRSVGVT